MEAGEVAVSQTDRSVVCDADGLCTENKEEEDQTVLLRRIQVTVRTGTSFTCSHFVCYLFYREQASNRRL